MLVFFPQLNITKTLKLSSLCLSFSLISSQSYAAPQALLQNLSGQWQGSTYYAQSEPTKVATQIAANLTPDQGILTFNITYSADGLQNYAVKVMSFDKEAQL
ncbi:MAG: hypothetical protein ACRCT7_14310 [Shewanella sp.]